MRFDVGKYGGKPRYRIESDTHGWTVTRYVGQVKKKQKDGSFIEENNFSVIGYSQTLGYAITLLAEQHLRWEEGSSVLEALQSVRQLGDDLRVVFAAVLPPAPLQRVPEASEPKKPGMPFEQDTMSHDD